MTNIDGEHAIDYTQCYVAFLDILGFKELVRRSMDGAELRAALVRALKEVASLSPTQHSKRKVTYHKDGSITASPWKDWTTQIRAFSDNVAVFVPVQTDGLCDVLCKVRYLHDRLLELHCCVRGAVTIGGMYWDDSWCSPRSSGATGNTTEVAPATSETVYDRERPSNEFITLGPGLVEAYNLESEVAIYPRVILSPALVAHINTMSKTKPENAAEGIHKAAHAVFLCPSCPENAERSITDFIRVDADGVPFLDLFHKDIDRDDVQRIVREVFADGRTCTRWIRDDMTHERFMSHARATIEEHLKEQCPDKVRAKYLWLANYFNSAASHLDIAPLPVAWSPPNG